MRRLPGCPACDNACPLMDPSRKRQIRLVVALSFAVLLATGLVYTSFNASSEARQPSELSNATPGKSYEMTGKVVPGSVSKDGAGIELVVSDRAGGPQVYVMDAGGGGQRRVSFAGSYNTSPSFAPDNQTIAYSGRAGPVTDRGG